MPAAGPGAASSSTLALEEMMSDGSDGKWTPDQRMQLLKEGVAAILAILLVVFTVIIASRAFAMAGDEQRMADAQEVLTVLVGLSGVVLGYYFGRAPADARAAQMSKQLVQETTRATAKADKAMEMASHIESVMNDPKLMSGDPAVSEAVKKTRRAHGELLAM